MSNLFGNQGMISEFLQPAANTKAYCKKEPEERVKNFVQSCTSSKYFVYMEGIDDFDQDVQTNNVIAVLRVT
ncbi:MAG: hypothetical protein EA363_13025 [Balneolaceae bacterium]|nr:MAG: hypothetical protein EA363_13025 [Balneolaceae bacterium]